MNLELDAVRKINGLAGKVRPFDLMMDLITRYGHWAFVIYGLLLWFAPGKKKEERRLALVLAFLGVVICSLISFVIGKLWDRARPFTKDWRIWNFTGHKVNASFPSNHSMNGALVAMTLLRYHLPGSHFMAAFSLLLAFSRIFAGMHYPSDILGGFTIAGIVHYFLNLPLVKSLILPLAALASWVSDGLGKGIGKWYGRK